MKRNNIIIAAILIFTFTFLFCGASLANNSSTNVIVKSSDGKMSLSVPQGWNTNDTTLYPSTAIGVSDSKNSRYAIVILRKKSEFSAKFTLNDYLTDNVKRLFNILLTNPVWSKTTSIKIGDCKGLAISLSGKNKRTRADLTYYFNILEDKNNFYCICGWTITSKVKTNKSVIKNIINSFKETE